MNNFNRVRYRRTDGNHEHNARWHTYHPTATMFEDIYREYRGLDDSKVQKYEMDRMFQDPFCRRCNHTCDVGLLEDLGFVENELEHNRYIHQPVVASDGLNDGDQVMESKEQSVDNKTHVHGFPKCSFHKLPNDLVSKIYEYLGYPPKYWVCYTMNMFLSQFCLWFVVKQVDRAWNRERIPWINPVKIGRDVKYGQYQPLYPNHWFQSLVPKMFNMHRVPDLSREMMFIRGVQSRIKPLFVNKSDQTVGVITNISLDPARPFERSDLYFRPITQIDVMEYRMPTDDLKVSGYVEHIAFYDLLKPAYDVCF